MGSFLFGWECFFAYLISPNLLNIVVAGNIGGRIFGFRADYDCRGVTGGRCGC